MNELYDLTKTLARMEKFQEKKLRELSKAQVTLRWMKRCLSLLEALGPDWCIVDPIWDADYESSGSLYIDIYEAIRFRNKNAKDYLVYFDWSMISIQNITQDEDPLYEEFHVFEPDETPPPGFLDTVRTIKEAATYINTRLASFKNT